MSIAALAALLGMGAMASRNKPKNAEEQAAVDAAIADLTNRDKWMAGYEKAQPDPNFYKASNEANFPLSVRKNLESVRAQNAKILAERDKPKPPIYTPANQISLEELIGLPALDKTMPIGTIAGKAGAAIDRAEAEDGLLPAMMAVNENLQGDRFYLGTPTALIGKLMSDLKGVTSPLRAVGAPVPRELRSDKSIPDFLYDHGYTAQSFAALSDAKQKELLSYDPYNSINRQNWNW